MDYKILLLPLILLMAMAAASATVTVTINSPATGTTFQPNLTWDDRCIDINFTVVDDNANGSPMHTLNLFYDYNQNDANTYMAADVNLDSGECKFGSQGDYVWSTPGADCVVNYCWSTHSPPSGAGYLLDANVSSDDSAGAYNDGAEGLISFNLYNRYISTAVEALVNTAPIVLAGAIIVTIVLSLLGVVSPRTVIILLPALIIVLVALLIFGTIVNVMTV